MGKAKRVAVVAGLRTPFAKQGTEYADLTALDLGKAVVSELVQRTGMTTDGVEALVYGQVVPTRGINNLAREVGLASGLASTVDAYSVSRACATSYQAVASLCESILCGTVSCGIAGGADSASDLSLVVGRRLSRALSEVRKADGVARRLGAMARIRPSDLLPQLPPLIEPSTGLTMGQIAEKMAKENGITRAAQDDYAHLSHTRAARAFEAGFMDGYVMRMYLPPSFAPVTRDNLVRFDSTRAAYDKLSPVFDRAHGTVTAGTSSALSDGASALLLMSEPRAKERNLAPLGYVRSFAFAALDPRGQTLMGPAYATPIALRRAGLELSDVDLIDVHEAFAAQVLSNIQAFESEAFARVELNLVRSIGKVDLERLNVLGGSIAMGHPFAATGGRQIVQTLSELRRRGLQFGLCTTCAAGGLGAAMVLEAA